MLYFFTQGKLFRLPRIEITEGEGIIQSQNYPSNYPGRFHLWYFNILIVIYAVKLDYTYSKSTTPVTVAFETQLLLFEFCD